MVSNKEQYGFHGLVVKGITVHNTGNFLSAWDNQEYMEHSKGSGGCHFLVDEKETIQAMPLDWCVYHTGMGIDWACKHTIAIEICRSMEAELYSKAEMRAVELIKSLMEEYGLTEKDIYFHQDFRKQTYCPHKILDDYGNKENWIKGVF